MSPSDSSVQARTPSQGPRRLPGHAHLRVILDDLATGIFTFDAALELQHVSARVLSLLGITPELGQHARTVLDLLDSSPLDDDAKQRLHETCLTAAGTMEPQTLTFTAAAQRAGSRSFTLDITHITDGSRLAVLEETTDRLAAEANAVERALHDPLTGLPTRRLFQKSIAESLAEQNRVALLMVDLDRFKSVNDTLGHPIGDALLGLVGKRLRATVREVDIVARLGGDEFALLIAPAPDTGSLEQLGHRIVDLLSRPYLVQGHLVNIGASVGIAVAPEHGPTADLLFTHADLALYNAKQSGRGLCRFFARDMDERAAARRLLEIDLRKALALREFELYYQPQIELENEQLVGFEALLRWRHPVRGLVSPADFIPLAEEIGLINAIGEWVIRQACAEASTWPSTIAVAVNVSPHQFGNPSELVDTVRRALATSGLPGHRLEIEITESSLLQNEDLVLSALHGLRAMNVRVAMDDFGTGYSSLSQLGSFPFDKIKIDRSFIIGGSEGRASIHPGCSPNGSSSGSPNGSPGCSDASQDAIIRAITALGASLGMSTIAEGVETTAQLSRLRAEGCTSVQGYFFSRPVPVSKLDALITRFNGPQTSPNQERTNA